MEVIPKYPGDIIKYSKLIKSTNALKKVTI